MNALLFFLIFCLGASVGSFVNVLVFRTRGGVSLVHPGSRCPSCAAPIRRRHNIPVIGFLVLRGRCRDCRGRISMQYPLVELFLGAAFVGMAFLRGASGFALPPSLVRDWFIMATLAAVFLYDARYAEIPDRFTLLPALFLFLAGVFFDWQSWYSMALGALVGAGFFLFQFAISRGRWIGGGDIRLGLLMGVILGWPGILVGLFLSYIFGAVAAVGLLAAQKKRFGDALPFGTFLAIGTVFTMLSGQAILSWYMSFLQ